MLILITASVDFSVQLAHFISRIKNKGYACRLCCCRCRQTWLLSDTPCKVFAAQTSGAGIDIWIFLLASIPARFLRFAIVTTFCHYVSGYMVRAGIRFSPVMVLLFFWLLFYTFYFMVMRG